jgi:hypothetical protein
MASTVQESIDVHVPIRTAYDQWTQFESFPNFMDGVEAISRLDDTHTHWKVRVGGQEREFDAAVTERRPDERVAWRSTGGTRHAGVVTFHRLSDDDTRVTVRMDWQPEGFAEKAGAAIGIDDRRVKADLRRFKSFIERGRTGNGGSRGEALGPDAARQGQRNIAPGGDQGYGSPGGDQGYGSPGGDQGYGSPGGDQGYVSPGGDQGRGAPGGDQGSDAPGGERGRGTPRTPGSPAGGW